ncbi:ferrous iron transport protein B [Sulfurospirillum sp. hDNRA2]|uniref:ferrous iron transport protein B n=1 Tax=Sulfurospirillum sp. hDNRA2 TaxID=3237298 RepID=UPI0020B65FDD|nr:ferrous iron transport protein B [Sulfurospirillum sp. DNRA8]MCP3652683.1 ferrous iron transport protein B [Sulfurospirillum sp. DNRA8]MCR1811534.1 ferrous iron transport protein B [Sulfurospirillum sp. DNRA8]
MKKITIALVGQPNVGKSHLANAISGSNLKIGNFAGVTVEKATAKLRTDDYAIEFIDLPGLYSLEDFSADEKVTKEFLKKGDYDLIVNVLDSTNLERNLMLTTELLELNKKIVLALNMDDEAVKEGININAQNMSKILSVPCIRVSSKTKYNIETLVDTIIDVHEKALIPSKLIYGSEVEDQLQTIARFLEEKHFTIEGLSYRQIAVGLLWQKREIYAIVHEHPLYVELQPILNNALGHVYMYCQCDEIDEVIHRQHAAFAKGLCTEVLSVSKIKAQSVTQKIDAVLIHKFLGLPIFVFLMWALFQLTFTLGQFPMDWIESGFGWLGETLGETIDNEALKSLIVDGIIAGVGSVLMFLPNIIILFLGIALLETTGYMSRAAFLLDGFFHKFGLHGKSFVPLVTGFGCSVPAYMAARTLKNKKDRLLTMFIIGFMSCGARLPVYVLFAGAFFDESVAGNVLFAIYIFGAILGLIAAKILRVTAFKGEDEPFVMEMPKYRLPSLKLLWFMVYSKSVLYLKKAGTFILLASMLIWFISSYPKNDVIEEEYGAKIEALQATQETQATDKEALTAQKDDTAQVKETAPSDDKVTSAEADKEAPVADPKEKESAEEGTSVEDQIAALENEKHEKIMEQTYLGMAGKAVEPFFAPLGFDWKMGVATLSGLAAKEVIVSTLGVLYALGDEVSEDDASLRDIIKENISFASAMAFIVFVMVYLPCLAATAVFYKEAESLKHTVLLVLFTFATAWVLAFITYRVLLLVA